jgi:hypothetical protein
MLRLERHAMIRYLTLKNLSVAEITIELQTFVWYECTEVFGGLKVENAFQDGSDNLYDLARSGRPSHSDLAAPIQSFLQQFPFISSKVLCCTLKIGKATCLRVLRDVLHVEKFNLRDVPHSLEADQTRSWVELSRVLLQIPEQVQQY